MKKQIILLSIVLFSFHSLQAQKINYELSFEKARRLALEQKKPLAILLTIQMPANIPDSRVGLDDKKVIEVFNTGFINYRADKDDTAASGKIIREFKINRLPSLIFLDPKGGFMFTDIAILSRGQQLLDLATKAIQASKEKSLIDYDSAFKAGNINTGFLKEYILRREKAGITDNADLIETYVDGLKVSDLKNYNEVLFILKAGPFVDGSAYKLASTHRFIIDSIFKTEPLADRIALNNAIINNTMINAIANKNFTRAGAAANYTRGTWLKDYKEGQKAWYLKIVQYYAGVKDTASYLKNAAFYYDQYYMSISVDSVRKKDAADFEALKNRAREQSTMVYQSDTEVRRTLSFSYTKDRYATDLNNIAWSFYLMAGNKSDYLVKAMLWSRRSIELSPKPAFYDTFAHLLYKLKFFDEAESAEKKAIEAGKAENSNIKIFLAEYEKIKNRNL